MGDVGVLRARAAELRSAADQLTATAMQVAQASDVAWVSSAADRWRREVEDLTSAMHAESEQLRATAVAFDRQADDVEAAQAAARAAQAWFSERLADARRMLSAGAEAASDTALAAARELQDAARGAPPLGSPDWRWWRA